MQMKAGVLLHPNVNSQLNGEAQLRFSPVVPKSWTSSALQSSMQHVNFPSLSVETHTGSTAQLSRLVLPGSLLMVGAAIADTPDFEGRGESAPVPYFFQNLAEAEYMVTLYQFMRLVGYPAEKISMLTTYNGQKALLRDVVERRCAHHPAFGMPHQVSPSLASCMEVDTVPQYDC